MFEFLDNLVANLAFIFERLNWLSALDILLVAAVFFAVLLSVRGTQAVLLLRGIFFWSSWSDC